MASEKLTVDVTGTDNLSVVLKQIGRNMSDLKNVGVIGLGMAFANMVGGVITGLGNIARKVLDVGRDIITIGADFEEQMVILEMASDGGTQAIADLDDIILKVGGDTNLMGISASGAAVAVTDLYKAGFTTTEIFGDLAGYMADNAELSGILRAAIDLQAASELELAQASESVAVAMATFGLDASLATDIANNFVMTADASTASVQDLADAMINIGPTAAAFGFAFEDVNIALAILSTRGIKGAEAGTALKSMLTNLMRPTENVTEALDALGVSLYDREGQMFELPNIIQQLSIALADLTEQERNQYVQTLAGTYGMKALQTLISEGIPGWKSMTEAIQNASTAQEVGTARTETFRGKMEAFDGTVEALKIGIANAFLPALTRLADKFGDFIGKHGPMLTEVFEELGEVIEVAVDELLPELIKWLEDDGVDAVKELTKWIRDDMGPEMKEWFKTIKNDVVPTLKSLWDIIKDVIDVIGKLTGKTDKAEHSARSLGLLFQNFPSWITPVSDLLAKLKLPDWLVPGSPTPLELALKGIRGEMQALAAMDAPTMGAGMLGSTAASASAALTPQTIKQDHWNLTIHSLAQTENVIATYQTMKAMAGANL